MALTKDMSLKMMESFLLEEVKEQILYDITPILHLGYSSGGYFGVTRQIACMFDFLGALYFGFDSIKDVESRKRGKVRQIRRIAKPEKALSFIEEILGSLDENYKVNGKYLIEMYRNGLVHLYQPKELILKGGKILKWLPYKGPRTNDIIVNHKWIIKGATHLHIIEDRGQSFLPVSIKCLYDDLMTSIDVYVSKLRDQDKLQKNFISCANEICTPDKLEEMDVLWEREDSNISQQ